MFQATSSGAGKSTMVAAFCRILSNSGFKVAPFKAQNMSLNAGVTAEGLEMSIAQVVQAIAAKVEPDVRMNPVLLKPQGDGYSQLIIMGENKGLISFSEYYQHYNSHFEIVKKAYDSLSKDFDIIVLEGAGSPSEINLQAYDIVNMRMASYSNSDVFIIGDIDRGGVFAAFKGTFDLIEDSFKSLVKGFIINKFRGDINILRPGLEMFYNILPVKLCGVVPYTDIHLEDEDSQFLKEKNNTNSRIKIAIIKLKFMSNFTDFLPLLYLDDFSVSYVDENDDLAAFDLIILPGTKNTVKDMEYLNSSGLYNKIIAIKGKTWVLGICGGFQLLGEGIVDASVENKGNFNVKGLEYIDMITYFEDRKVLKKGLYRGSSILKDLVVEAYEIHNGRSVINESVEQLLEKDDLFVFKKPLKVAGTYLHGLFYNKAFVENFFNLMGFNLFFGEKTFYDREYEIERLSSLVEESCDVRYITDCNH